MRLVFLLLFVPILSVAAQQEFNRQYMPLGPGNRSTIVEIFKTIGTHPIAKGTFTQTKKLTRLGRSFVSKGNFIFSAKDGLLWNIKTPFASVLLMANDRMVQRTPDGRESVMGGNEVFKRFSHTIQAVFKGDTGLVEVEFVISFTSVDGNWYLKLEPRDKSFRSIIATMFIRGRQFIESFRIVESTGDSVDYVFSDTFFPERLSLEEEKFFAQ